MTTAATLAEQRTIFARELAPLLGAPLVRWFAARPASLYGLGIPPSQYRSLAASHGDGIVATLGERLERLACDFPLAENYFAWQAFGRAYAPGPRPSVPPYLEERWFEAVKARSARVDVRHASVTAVLEASAAESVDAFVLLDAQDWMTDEDLTALWRQIARTAKPGARVIFRTAGIDSILPGRVPEDILARWSYDAERCREFTRRDRSSIYGGFHLYELRSA
jgi:S-adenosylmethionine-diacylglycerol 3-amino-3-carboxypropyl transferase